MNPNKPKPLLVSHWSVHFSFFALSELGCVWDMPSSQYLGIFVDAKKWALIPSTHTREMPELRRMRTPVEPTLYGL